MTCFCIPSPWLFIPGAVAAGCSCSAKQGHGCKPSFIPAQSFQHHHHTFCCFPLLKLPGVCESPVPAPRRVEGYPRLGPQCWMGTAPPCAELGPSVLLLCMLITCLQPVLTTSPSDINCFPGSCLPVNWWFTANAFYLMFLKSTSWFSYFCPCLLAEGCIAPGTLCFWWLNLGEGSWATGNEPALLSHWASYQ